MAIEMTCYECRFFSPGELGCPSYLHNEELGEFEEAKEGICRRHTPRHGKTLKRPNGDEFICFAEWPKVMHCDWCGEFERRHTDGHTKECDGANCAKGSGNRE
jgi:hypothetical protein